MPLDDGILSSVSNINVKVLGETPAFYTAQAMGDSVAHQRRVYAISEAALGSIVKNLTEIDVSEAVAVKQGTTGNAVAEAMASLGAAIASLQQVIKGAQSTPPETAKT